MLICPYSHGVGHFGYVVPHVDQFLADGRAHRGERCTGPLSRLGKGLLSLLVSAERRWEAESKCGNRGGGGEGEKGKKNRGKNERENKAEKRC